VSAHNTVVQKELDEVYIVFFFFLGERFLIFGYIEMLTVMNVTVNIYVYMYNLGVFFLF